MYKEQLLIKVNISLLKYSEVKKISGMDKKSPVQLSSSRPGTIALD